jgi:hypothetical protein
MTDVDNATFLREDRFFSAELLCWQLTECSHEMSVNVRVCVCRIASSEEFLIFFILVPLFVISGYCKLFVLFHAH